MRAAAGPPPDNAGRRSAGRRVRRPLPGPSGACAVAALGARRRRIRRTRTVKRLRVWRDLRGVIDPPGGPGRYVLRRAVLTPSTLSHTPTWNVPRPRAAYCVLCGALKEHSPARNQLPWKTHDKIKKLKNSKNSRPPRRIRAVSHLSKKKWMIPSA